VVENEPVSVLNSEFASETLEANVIESLRDRKSEDFSTNPDVRLSESPNVLNNEFFSAMLKAVPRESARSLPMPLL
jgi:hypothetical protein